MIHGHCAFMNSYSRVDGIINKPSQVKLTFPYIGLPVIRKYSYNSLFSDDVHYLPTPLYGHGYAQPRFRASDLHSFIA